MLDGIALTATPSLPAGLQGECEPLGIFLRVIFLVSRMEKKSK